MVYDGSDTPVLGRHYCPTCEPDTDPFGEILDVRYCGSHAAGRTTDIGGSQDDVVVASAYLSGSAEAGGESNKLLCDFLHRGAEPCRDDKNEQS